MKLVILMSLLAVSCSKQTFSGEELSARDVYVIDGDSVRIDGENTRLMGLDTPETFQPQCESERALGYEAKERLRTELNDAESIQIVYETKSNGDLRLDKYGRRLASLYIDGKDVAQIQINAGLARVYDGGKRQSWCD